MTLRILFFQAYIRAHNKRGTLVHTQNSTGRYSIPTIHREKKILSSSNIKKMVVFNRYAFCSFV